MLLEVRNDTLEIDEHDKEHRFTIKHLHKAVK